MRGEGQFRKHLVDRDLHRLRLARRWPVAARVGYNRRLHGPLTITSSRRTRDERIRCIDARNWKTVS